MHGADPLHRLDCCVISDGGGALVVVAPEVARDLPRQTVKVLGHGESPKLAGNGRIELTHTGAVWSGPRAFEDAGVTPGDIDYASIYDSFTITVLQTIEDLGFCEKGEGGAFVADGSLLAPHGKLPFNTDGGLTVGPDDPVWTVDNSDHAVDLVAKDGLHRVIRDQVLADAQVLYAA